MPRATQRQVRNTVHASFFPTPEKDTAHDIGNGPNSKTKVLSTTTDPAYSNSQGPNRIDRHSNAFSHQLTAEMPHSSNPRKQPIASRKNDSQPNIAQVRVSFRKRYTADIVDVDEPAQEGSVARITKIQAIALRGSGVLGNQIFCYVEV